MTMFNLLLAGDLKTCQCSGQYVCVNGNCLLPNDGTAQCTKTSECADQANGTCSDGYCQCNGERKWTYYYNQCLVPNNVEIPDASSFVDCMDQSDTTAYFSSISGSRGKCVCSQPFVWDDGKVKCGYQNIGGTTCNKDEECYDYSNGGCIGNQCLCRHDYAWNATHQICKALNSGNISCNALVECYDHDFLGLCNGTCTCLPGCIFYPLTNNCRAPCNGTIACRNDTFCIPDMNGGCYGGYCSCRAGYFWDLTLSLCSPCAAGTYKSSDGPGSCLPCAVGKYSGIGSTICNECPTGNSCPTASSDPIQCNSGWYQDQYSQTNCKPCPAGTYAEVKGLITCAHCPAGYMSSARSSLCTPCNTGYYSSSYGSASCYECGPGTYQNLAAQTGCIPCPVGYYEDEMGKTQCKACPAGTYNNQTGMSTVNACVVCPPSTYNANTGSAECTACPPDSKSEINATICTCNNGSYYNSTEPINYCPGTLSLLNLVLVCDEFCTTCNVTATNCTSCAENTFIPAAGGACHCPTENGFSVVYSNTLQTNQCVCPDNTLLQRGKCRSCHPLCDGCTVLSDNSRCTACAAVPNVVSTVSADNLTSTCECAASTSFDSESSMCVYTSGCHPLCAGKCASRNDASACVSACNPTAAPYVADEVSAAKLVVCTCGSDTVFDGTNCASKLTVGCSALCGSGCTETVDAGKCVDCIKGRNVVSQRSDSGNLRNCSCAEGTELVGSTCGYTSGCSPHCVGCTSQNDDSACIACAEGTTAGNRTGAGEVSCTCPDGTLYDNGTCAPVLSSASGSNCYPLCAQGCVVPNDQSQCAACKLQGDGLVLSEKLGDVFNCSCREGSRLSSSGECVLNIRCDSLCEKCADDNTCLACPSGLVGAVLSEGKCICSIADGYVLMSDGTCFQRKAAIVSSVQYAGYLLCQNIA